MFFLKKNRRDGAEKVMAKAGLKIDWTKEAKTYICAAEKTAKIKGKTLEELVLLDGEYHFFSFAADGGARVLEPEIEGPIRSKIFLEVLKIIGVTWPTPDFSGEDTSMETPELECLDDVDMGDFEPEPTARPLTRSQKFHAKLCAFADKIPGLLTRGVLIAIALGAVYFNGYSTANRDFDRAVNQGWYIKNATKFDEAAKNIITPGAWSPENEKETK